MGDRLLTLVGVGVGFLFGMSGIATLFNLLGATIGEAARQVTNTRLTQLNVATTLVLLVAVLVLIFKIRVIASLIIGAIIGAVLNIILELNGIHVTNQIYSMFK